VGDSRQPAATGTAYVFEAVLDGDPGVKRTVSLAGSATLDDLSALFREEFGWHDPHLYSFWLDGEYWGDSATEYTAPYDLEAGDKSSAEVTLSELGLQEAQRIAYIFDFGDEWRVAITVQRVAADDVDEPLPRVLERTGSAPPQYEPDGD
jgi:hypothetical protein